MAAKTGRPNAAGLWLATGSDARNALPLVRMNLDRKAPRLRSPVPRHRRLGSRARGVAVVPKQRPSKSCVSRLPSSEELDSTAPWALPLSSVVV